jgi:hypothetical protein
MVGEGSTSGAREVHFAVVEYGSEEEFFSLVLRGIQIQDFSFENGEPRKLLGSG